MKIRFSVLLVLVATAVSAYGDGLRTYNLPPAHRLMRPGPGVDGPGPGVLAPQLPHSLPMMAAGGQANIQVLFNRPDGMQVRWDVGGVGQFDSEPLVLPGRKNFPQGGLYRLKLTNIAAREGVELYPSLEIGPITPRTSAYLAHNAIPVQFTEEDLDQVQSGNFVTKVIYLPDPEFQELALAGVETLVSTRLDPGVDPITEADRRGSIMAVIRLGNKDIEMPGTVGESVVSASFNGNGGGGVLGDGGAYYGGGAAYGGGGGAYGGGAVYGDAYGGGIVGGMPGPHVSGVTTPSWGMSMSSTPIGLPGPPHIPFGHPAGLQRHVIKNHTKMHIPGPTEKLRIHVRETPGYSYPKPVSRVRIREQHIHPAIPFSQPTADRVEVVH